MKTMLMTAVALAAAGCLGADPLQGETDAERYAPAVDVRSCYATRSPTGCGPAIACDHTVLECAAAGCWVQGTDLYLYGDGSWRRPEPGPGAWSTRAEGDRTFLVLGGESFQLAEAGAPADDFACP